MLNEPPVQGTAPANGIWKLVVTDQAAGATGSILSWSLRFSTPALFDPAIVTPGEHQIIYSVEDCFGCVRDRVHALSVAEPPLAYAGPDHTGCIGLSSPLGGSPTATGGAGNYVYFWEPCSDLQPCSGSSAAAANPMASPAGPMTYTLRVMDGNGCFSEPSLVQTDPQKTPQAGFSVFTEGPTVDFQDQSVPIGSPIASWTWDFGDGNSSQKQNPTHRYLLPGAYQACLTAENAQGCTGTICKTVNIAISGLQGPAVEGLKIYPNPVSGRLIIEAPGAGELHYTLFDARGAMCGSGVLDAVSGRGTLQLEGLPAGVYLVELRSGDGIRRVRVVKE